MLVVNTHINRALSQLSSLGVPGNPTATGIGAILLGAGQCLSLRVAINMHVIVQPFRSSYRTSSSRTPSLVPHYT